MRQVYTSHNWSIIPFASFGTLFFPSLSAKLPNIMMQFGFFNHRFSSYSAAVRFPATKVCSAISASNSTQQASSCACDQMRRKQQASQWKTWANVLDRPTLLWLFSGAITFFRRYGREMPADGIKSLGSIALRRASVCVCFCRLTQNFRCV